MPGGKSEMARLAKEAVLAAGKTIIVATPEAVTKWTRHWRRGRYVDVAEDLKKPSGGKVGEFWIDEMRGK